MKLRRRDFFRWTGAAVAASLGGTIRLADATSSPEVSDDAYGCLVDTTLCVGCRKCEEACNKRHMLAAPKESFEEMAVLENERRPDDASYTVINKYYPKNVGSLTWLDRPVFVKFQCMHCLDPACVSACVVGALTKQPEGPVIYDASKCIGCRYCMVACPFQIPAYEYEKALTPQVRKCSFCFEYYQDGRLPACAEVCPREAIVFGKRKELLTRARQRIQKHPGRYIDKIYGEHEVGGTSWIYLASEQFEKIGFPQLGSQAPPRLTEMIQHTIFRYFAAPIGLFVALAGIMGITNFYKKDPSLKE